MRVFCLLLQVPYNRCMSGPEHPDNKARRMVTKLARRILSQDNAVDMGTHSRKVLKHALMQAVAHEAVNPDPQEVRTRPWLFQDVLMHALARLHRPHRAESGLLSQREKPVVVRDYSDTVASVLGHHRDLVYAHYISRPDSLPGRYMRSYYMDENIRGNHDSFDDATTRGKNSARRHIAAVVNHAVLSHAECSNRELSDLLTFSYGTIISPFMEINQDLFGRLLRPEVDMYVDVPRDGQMIPSLNPAVVYERQVKAKGRVKTLLMPDWEAIFNLEVESGRFRSLGTFMIRASEVENSDVTAGCPFHELVSDIYPEIVHAVTGWQRT
ncbi:MAG: hypothetical protein TR69_WS6001000553 [candidate division WS6 bacterium OLB20]|uniref:Uncharacterized protein n=1 Tax=candidate division WS6 bacterium OLB20 TaxID=1617426 RepID=A0A136LY75_9BACT|nr:MAG: hypothetical protein TR69_WS6001000553 [candidate division WS6 bacterium OLB20]